MLETHCKIVFIIIQLIMISQKNYQKDQILAILPGSRKQEILTIIDTIVELISAYPEIKFLVAGVSNLDRKLYHPLERIW